MQDVGRMVYMVKSRFIKHKDVWFQETYFPFKIFTFLIECDQKVMETDKLYESEII